MKKSSDRASKSRPSYHSNALHKTMLIRLVVIFSILLTVVTALSSKAIAETYPFYIQTIPRSDTLLEIRAINGGNMPIILKINPISKASEGLKYATSNKPNTDTSIVIDKLTKKTVMTITSDRGVNVSNFKFTYAWTFGNPKKTTYMDYIYPFPYDKTENAVVEKLYKGNEETLNKRYKYAYKITGSGGKIITSRPGIVFDLRAYDTEVPNKSDEGLMGFVRVVHTDGTWSEYFDIPFDTIQVRINDYLPEGRVIAKADTFSFAVMLPTTEGVPIPIPYTINLKSGGQIHTPYIEDSLNLEVYNPDKYHVEPWFKQIIKTKSHRGLIIGFFLVTLLLACLGIYFYLRHKRKKAQALHTAVTADAEVSNSPSDDVPTANAISEPKQAETEQSIVSMPLEESSSDWPSEEELAAEAEAERLVMERLNKMMQNQANFQQSKTN